VGTIKNSFVRSPLLKVALGLILSTHCLALDNVPIFEYYENKAAPVKPIDDKYNEVKAEAISTNLNLPVPIYRTEKSGLIFNGSVNFLARTETFEGDNIPYDQQFFRLLSVYKAGFIAYTKTSDQFTPILMLNYFNHPTAGLAYRPMYDSYVGGKVSGRYTLLLRIALRPHGTTVTPLVGWRNELNEKWALDFMLPAHAKLIYTSESKNFIVTTGYQADSRDFPAEADQQKGWFTGYHIRGFAQLSVAVFKPVYLTVIGGTIYSSNAFYAYNDKDPTYAFRELPTGFLGGGLEANF
jgi:hypothetical protein